MKRLLATSLLAIGAYGLTLVTVSSVATADTPGGVTNSGPSVVLSPVTAALVDGDDIRARFILHETTDNLSPTGTTAAPDLIVLSALTAALADGDDIRARELATIER
jgi:hypothetical protein